MRQIVVIAAAAMVAACSSGGSSKGGTPTAATPTFSVASGTENAPISVTISSATAGAVIHYTTNGVDPTPSSATYAGAIAISTATTLKAIATASGANPSAVATATYAFQAATPTFSVVAGTYLTAQSVALSSATPGATIHYTLDGSTPTASSPSYAGPISLSVDPSTTTIKAIAVLAGFTDSAVASATYEINSAATPAATPTFSPGAGSYGTVQDVTISCATAGATIYYTTDGSAPTTASTVYAAPVHVASSLTLKAIATAAGHTASGVGSATYTLTMPQAATPTFSPTPGSYASAQSVTISCASAGATIHYTTDGSTPTDASTTYGGAIAVSATTTLKAIATGASYTPSAVASATYTITGGGGGGGTDFLTVCNTVTQKMSDLMVTCFKMNPDLLAALGGMGSCAETQKELTAGLVTYNATTGATCASDAAAMTCSSVLAGGDVNAPSSCNGSLTGTVANGTGTANVCYSTDDCANGYCTSDYGYPSTCPGHCHAFATSGQDCSNTDCAPGLVCDAPGTATTPTCYTPSAVNGACPCQGGLWCDTSGGGAGICKAPKTAGATCSGVDYAECAVGLTCFDGHCSAVVGSGGACTALADGSSACGPGYYCPSGACTGQKATGTCGATATYTGPAPECMSAYCQSGQCYPVTAGTTCSMP